MKEKKIEKEIEDMDNLTRLLKKIHAEAQKEARKIKKKAKLELEKFEKETNLLVEQVKEKEIEKEVGRFDFIRKRTESEYQQKARRILIQARESLIDEVFEQIEKELANFRSNSAYTKYIRSKLESTVHNIKNNDMKILIDKKDEKIIQEIVKEFNKTRKTNVIIGTPRIQTSGGFILTDIDERIKIDYTLENTLQVSRDTIRTKINEQLFS